MTKEVILQVASRDNFTVVALDIVRDGFFVRQL
jgi:hypothetical protein